MKILKLSAVQSAKFNNYPWEWGVIKDLITRQDAIQIASEIEWLDFRPVVSERNDKSYSMSLFEINKQNVQGERLNELLKDVRSIQYIKALSEFTATSLLDKECVINIWKYSNQNYLSPHLDKAEKYVTHLIYFSEEWPKSYGGCLNILKTSDEDSVIANIEPHYQNSVVIKTDDKSWHSVSPVKVEGVDRYCMQIIFLKT
ncbi:2OG-Fe(II) oxygenase, partial [Photorhabdus australis]